MNQQRLWAIGGAAAVAIAAVGFFTGTRPTADAGPRRDLSLSDPEVESEKAPRYVDLREGRRGPNSHMYEGAFAALHLPPEQASPASPEDRQAAVLARSGRRAYDGAPPTIPHEIDQRRYPDCLTCHEKGATIGGRRAPRMSHERYENCAQCHVVSSAPRPLPKGELLAESSFEGSRSPGIGERAYPGAPPTIPHHTWMRENCNSCHGAGGLHGLSTSHPWRQSCTQCHAPSAVLDQRVQSESPPPWERNTK